MISWLNYALMGLVAFSCFALHNIKNEARLAEAGVAKLEAKIVQEKEKIRLLKTEWTVLSEPAELQRLSERFLQLQPVEAGQIITYSELPLPRVFYDDPGRRDGPDLKHGAGAAQVSTRILTR